MNPRRRRHQRIRRRARARDARLVERRRREWLAAIFALFNAQCRAFLRPLLAFGRGEIVL